MMRIGVFKFSSCDGCQLAFFDMVEELLQNRDIQIDFFLEAQSNNSYEEFDIAFVEGSVSTEEEVEKIHDIRNRSKYLVAIGACAVSGGVQSIRNFMEFEDVKNYVYQTIPHTDILKQSKPISEFVKVDHAVRGCPINSFEIVETVTSIFLNKRPNLNQTPVCMECKLKGNHCLIILGRPCIGPITASGCGAICPSFSRGCYGCFGPLHEPNIEGMREVFRQNGWDLDEFILSSFNAYNPYYKDMIWR